MLIVDLIRFSIIMAVTFHLFSRKYPEFANNLDAFELFLPDAIAETSTYPFGNLIDVATELLVAHKISIAIAASGTTGSGGTLEELEVDDEGYRVKFQETNIKGGNNYSTTRYGIEYQRLLKKVTSNDSEKWSPTKGATYLAQRTDPNPQKW